MRSAGWWRCDEKQLQTCGKNSRRTSLIGRAVSLEPNCCACCSFRLRRNCRIRKRLRSCARLRGIDLILRCYYRAIISFCFLTNKSMHFLCGEIWIGNGYASIVGIESTLGFAVLNCLIYCYWRKCWGRSIRFITH